MRYLVLITAIATTVFLIGCTKCPHNYLTHAPVIPVMKSTSTPVKQGESYYPNTKQQTLSNSQSPSLIPPSIHLKHFEKQIR